MTNRWILRVAAIGLGLSIFTLGAGAIGFIRLSHARRTSLDEWNERRCSVYRSTFPRAADPCSESPSGPVGSTMTAVRADIAHARAALGHGDDETAARDLARALDVASRVERESSLIATAVAALEVSEVLDVVDAFPAVAARADLRAALARTKLETAQRPLEPERLRFTRRALEIGAPSYGLVTWGVTDARVSDEVEREDAALLSMQRAARAGDRQACERSGAKAHISGGICSTLVRTIATERRLSRRHNAR
jgi:hypothetical protein